MAESIVSDWLTDYEALEADEIRTFAAQHEDNHEMSSALYTIITERIKYPDVLQSVCSQLLSYYRSNESELKRFTLQFVPSLIYTYLNAVAQGDKKSCRSIETLLLGIYNIEVSIEDGQSKVISFRMPVLAQASIYHEEKSLNTYDLRRWEENSNKEVNWGPLPEIESVNAQNRLKVMTAVMFAYNQQLSLISKASLYHMCRSGTQLVNQGFGKYGQSNRSSYGNESTKPVSRIALSSPFLLEWIHAIYFAMFNEFASIAIQAIDDIHQRACYEYAEVILVTNAIKNSLLANPSGQPSDGPMGLSVAITPTTQIVTVSKSMITNASFRTKKLPDDIPIQSTDELNQSHLVSISEENAEVGGSSETTLGARNNLIRSSREILRTHKVPFSVFNKQKEKEKDGSNQSGLSKNQGANGVKESKIIAATKQLTKKDKKPSFQMASVDVTDVINNAAADKSSPILQSKRKSSSIDVANNTSMVNSIDLVPMQTFSNGNKMSTDDQKTNETFNENSTNNDKTVDASSVSQQQQRSSVIIDKNGKSSTVINNNVQMSQV